MFIDTSGVYIAASDYMKSLARSIAPWMPASYQVLGTDGYGLSESREELRDYFEISADHICQAALVQLLRTQAKGKRRIQSQIDALGINPDKPDPTMR
jgi:pyruvate dehydrogenase E1 component